MVDFVKNHQKNTKFRQQAFCATIFEIAVLVAVAAVTVADGVAAAAAVYVADVRSGNILALPTNTIILPMYESR